jgi:hypothetical protein
MDAWNAATPDISTVSRRLRVFPSSGDEARIQSMSLSWVAGLVCWISVRRYSKKGALSKLIGGAGFRSGLRRYQTFAL